MPLAMEMVGTYTRQCTAMSTSIVVKSVVRASPSIARPPIRWLPAMNFSAAKLRSANWLLKNIPAMAASGNMLRIQLCWDGEKSSPLSPR